MAKYVTTKCKNCGYATRNFESNIPKLQLGAPLIKCPKCGQLILDTISTEYEFMSDREKEGFRSSRQGAKVFVVNIATIAFGLVTLALSLFTPEKMGVVLRIFGILIGGGIAWSGFSSFRANLKAIDDKILEQSIYESLKRTQNKEYVKFIETVYSLNKIKRNYNAFLGKASFMEEYKFVELRKTYVDNMKEFNIVMSMLESNDSATKNSAKSSIF